VRTFGFSFHANSILEKKIERAIPDKKWQGTLGKIKKGEVGTQSRHTFAAKPLTASW
jgi:hypothetical protein